MADKEELYLRQANPHRAWYVIHTYSGYENKVKANLERLMHSASMSDMLFNVVVPVEDELEVKDGKEKVVPRKVFPGYVLVDMIVDEHSWYVVRNTTGVTGFVGSEKHPIPLTAEEAERILSGSVGGAPKAPGKGRRRRQRTHRIGGIRGLRRQGDIDRFCRSARTGGYRRNAD